MKPALDGGSRKFGTGEAVPEMFRRGCRDMNLLIPGFGVRVPGGAPVIKADLVLIPD